MANIEAYFKNDEEVVSASGSLYKYDEGQMIEVFGLSEDLSNDYLHTEFGFSGTEAKSYEINEISVGDTFICAIPDELLTQDGELIMYISLKTEKNMKTTIKRILIQVIDRPAFSEE